MQIIGQGLEVWLPGERVNRHVQPFSTGMSEVAGLRQFLGIQIFGEASEAMLLSSHVNCIRTVE